jgi:hypothetical protein
MLPGGTRCPTSACASSNCRSARPLPYMEPSSQDIEHTAGKHANAQSLYSARS